LEAFCYAINMQPKLIIIRGNSGSGKSTIAKELRKQMGENTMLVQQDVLRLGILNVKDRADNPAIELIANTVLYGKKIGYDVVLEGIFKKATYDKLINQLVKAFDGNVFAYYLDISFDETVRRHNTKPENNEFGIEKLREWWLENDMLGLENERIFNETESQDEMVNDILKDIKYV